MRFAGRPIAFVLLASLTACAHLGRPARGKDEPPVQTIRLPLVLMGVKVQDVRTDAGTTALLPTLTDAQTKMIEREIGRYFAGGKKVVIVTAELLTGTASFDESPAPAREESTVEVRLTFLDAIGREPLCVCNGSSTLTLESAASSAKSLKVLFEKTIRRAIFQAMLQTQELFGR